jgi:hypothetical protein
VFKNLCRPLLIIIFGQRPNDAICAFGQKLADLLKGLNLLNTEESVKAYFILNQARVEK